MKLRTRLLIVVLLALTVFVSAFYVLASITIDRIYARTDTQDVKRQVLRAHRYLDAQLGVLGGTCSDWAYWDDTYQYAADHNAEYVASNLSPESLATIDVDAMLFLDTSGRPIYVASSQTGTRASDETSQDIIRQFGAGTALLTKALSYPGVTGYTLVGDTVALVAARPILTSARSGPARGLVVAVQYLDPVSLSMMVDVIGGNVTMRQVSQVQQGTPESQALTLLAQGQSTVGLLTGTGSVMGFERITDLAGNSSLLLATTASRTQYDQIVHMKRVIVAGTSIVVIVVAIAGIFILYHTILKRIVSLGNQVASVGRTNDLSLRVQVPGSDELSHLAGSINETLESLQQTRNERRKIAAELEQDRQRLRTYFDRAHDLIFALDTDDKVTMANQSTCSILGYSENELIGRSMLDIITPESREFALRASEEVRSGNTVPTTTVDVVTHDGTRRTLDLSGQRLWEDGKVAGTFYIARDITDRLRMEHELLRSEALESLGTLAAGIAHDFNNVLTVVKGHISLADSSPDAPTEVRHDLELARTAVDRAQALAGQLLTFSRGGAPVKENVDVESLVREVAKFALSGSNIALNIRVDESLPAVEADRNQLFQVIQNIILNARDAMPSGGTLRIDIRRETVSQEHPVGFAALGDCVIIEMADNGPGITLEDMEHLFDPFFTTKPSGHGVGLTAARSIARRHGGDLLIESVVGKGTKVMLCLPAAQGPSTQPQTERQEVKPLCVAGRLLVMDDEPTVADVTCAMARRLGYETTAVPDGEAALTAYAQAVVDHHPFDLVIMDLTVPGGMGGREAVQRLLEIYPDARVVVASGYSDDASLAEYKQVGFAASLPKPYTMKDLERALCEAAGTPLS
ncbi:MAG: CHASE4 domain-containing protein [Candidatus Cryosericum sp.]